MTPDPLKPKPETLGFEREADTIANTLMAEWPKLGPSSIWLNLRRMILEALEAAFSKGEEANFKNMADSCKAEQKQSFTDGWNACREASAKVVEVMAAHHEGAYTGSKDLARGYRHAESVIRALKPAKGERI